MMVAIVRAYLPGGQTACSKKCNDQKRVSRYTEAIMGYRNHVVVPEKCECY